MPTSSEEGGSANVNLKDVKNMILQELDELLKDLEQVKVAFHDFKRACKYHHNSMLSWSNIQADRQEELAKDQQRLYTEKEMLSRQMQASKPTFPDTITLEPADSDDSGQDELTRLRNLLDKLDRELEDGDEDRDITEPEILGLAQSESEHPIDDHEIEEITVTDAVSLDWKMTRSRMADYSFEFPYPSILGRPFDQLNRDLAQAGNPNTAREISQVLSPTLIKKGASIAEVFKERVVSIAVPEVPHAQFVGEAGRQPILDDPQPHRVQPPRADPPQAEAPQDYRHPPDDGLPPAQKFDWTNLHYLLFEKLASLRLRDPE